MTSPEFGENIFEAVEDVAALFEKASPQGRQVAEVGAPLAHSLKLFAMTLKRTVRRSPIRVAGAVLRIATPVDIKMIVDDVYQSAIVTTRFVRASGMLSTYPEHLKFMKYRTKELHDLVQTLEVARDMVSQMQYGCADLRYAVDIFKAADRLIEAMSKTKATLASGLEFMKKRISSLRRVSQEEEQILKRDLEAASESMASSVQGMRKMLEEITDGWPNS